MANRLQVLDGWRGISILLVLAGHLFPLGPKVWQLNGIIASSGMAIFLFFQVFFNYQYFVKRPKYIAFFNQAVFAHRAASLASNFNHTISDSSALKYLLTSVLVLCELAAHVTY